jgi:hypothetical protein
MRHSDFLIPVVFDTAGEAGADDVVLREGEDAPDGSAAFQPDDLAGHAPGCGCCAARNPAGRALGALLAARARGEVAYFRRVIVVARSEAGRQAVEHALDGDAVVSECFRRDVFSS